MDFDLIPKGDWKTFLTLAGERLLLVKRQHWFVLVNSILFVGFMFLIFTSFSLFFFLYIVSSVVMFLVTLLLLTSLTITFITNSIIDWYFHIYVVTSRKLLELWYTPLSAHVMNEVLLDKVNCTELDFRKNGFWHQLLDLGDIAITFDRPTSQQEFIFKDVNNCSKLGRFLTQHLINNQSQTTNTQTIWLKERHAYS